MRPLFLILIYLMFFLSGSAALMYQVVWVRSLSLVFGGSHLAITTVLSVFMAGLAIGGYFIGRFTDRVEKQLKLYGWLEIGIAIFAILFFILNKAYPDIYRFLARGQDDSYLYLTLIRIVFSVVALIGPTILMGGTLPVLTRFISKHPGSLRTHLSFLYGTNTLGAVLGALAAGFFFLRFYSVSTTLFTAIALNVSIGITSLLLQRRGETWLYQPDMEKVPVEIKSGHPSILNVEFDKKELLPLKLVLLGAGVSGFCALGYEVLWTRMLSVVSGATVYAFTTMLIAFLTGIALGSAAYGLTPGMFRLRDKGITRSVVWFGFVQITIGILALAVSILIRDLPEITVRVYNVFGNTGLAPSELRIWVNFILAFAYMLLPAFFMGVAFPLAGKVHGAYRNKVGIAVGEILSYNTIGAILGAAASGFLLIHFLGIERSLQILVVVNVGFGLLVCTSTLRKKFLNGSVAIAMTGFLLFLCLDHTTLRFWNTDHFATFRSNEIGNYFSPELVPLISDFTDVLFYGEGLETIVSVTNVGARHQSLVVNGKVVAATMPQDLQVQFSLGHLPMLLHPDPEKVLVVGLGTGMTLGATSVHPSVEEITLAEIEPQVVPAARTFQDYNHRVLDNPKLKIIYNDGRNFLYTTNKIFDVITADPIHPWAQGASYLYTKEYYETALKHLSSDGIMCQWLPLYELSTTDWRAVVKTFKSVFPEVMVWVTHSDGILIGSRTQLVLDEQALEKRIAQPEIHNDLSQVMMGSSADLLSYFVSGTVGAGKFGSSGIINTDDNLYLEFSAPLSVGKNVMDSNLRAVAQHREPILPYLLPAEDNSLSESQIKRWKTREEAAMLTDEAHALFLGINYVNEKFDMLASLLDRNYSEYAPWQFLKTQVIRKVKNTAVPLHGVKFVFSDKEGKEIIVALAATKVSLSDDVSVVIFTDQKKNIKGYFRVMEEPMALPAVNVAFGKIQEIYREQAGMSGRKGLKYPAYQPAIRRIDEYLGSLFKEFN